MPNDILSAQLPTPTTREAEGSGAQTRAMAQSKMGRVGGKGWKLEKSATKRSYLQPGVKSPSFAYRMLKQQKADSVKALEREMHEAKRTEDEQKRTALKERKERHEEKKRLEEMRARMSAKKLQRQKKRLGRTKKINA